MNIFTAEHPLCAQPSCFDRDHYPILSLACRAVVSALLVAPVLYGIVLLLAFTDDVQCTDEPPFPQSWTELVWGAGAVFLLCVILAFVLVLIARLVGGYSGNRKIGKRTT